MRNDYSGLARMRRFTKCHNFMRIDRVKEVFRKDGVRLKLSSPSEFNDPFDSTGVVSGPPMKSFIDEYLSVKTNLLDTKVKGLIVAGDYEELGKIVRDDLSSALESRKVFDDFIRIFCVAAGCVDDNSSSLMWSHYADKSQGVRVEIDFSETPVVPLPICYCASAPILDLIGQEHYSGDIPDMARFLIDCIFTKNLAWSYEHEMRAIFPIADFDAEERCRRGVTVIKDGDTYYWQPNRSAITRIDFGVMADKQKVKETIEMLIENGYQDVGVFLAKKDSRSYGYEYIPYRK